MIRTRTRKILRDLTSRKARTALVSIAIFIGVLGVVTLTSLQEIIIDQMNDNFQEDQMPMFSAALELEEDASADFATNSPTLLPAMQNYPGVTVAEGRIREPFYWREADDESFLGAGLFASEQPLGSWQIEPAELIEGNWPTVGQHELAIERRMADRYELEIGDEIVVRNLKGLENRDPSQPIPEETWKITGLTHHPYIFEGNTSVYLNLADAQALTDISNYTFVMARFTDVPTARTNSRGLVEAINAGTPYRVDDWEWFDPAENEFIEEINQWAGTLTALSILAMIVSSFLVITVISTIVAEQRRQIGVMKSIGATRPVNQQIYTGIAFAYGLIGTIPGVLLGIPAAYGLALVVAPLMEMVIEGFVISPTGIIVGTALGLIIPVIAAIIPVFMGTRVTILEAMTDLGISGNYGHGPLARLIKRLPLPANMRQAFANLSQKKSRLFLTGFTLTLAVGSFMGVTALFMALGSAIDDIFGTFNFEVGVYPEHAADLDKAAQAIEENVDGVAAVIPSTSSGDINIVFGDPQRPNNRVGGYAFLGVNPENNAIELNLLEGHMWRDANEEGVIITSVAADDFGLAVGDTITLQSAEFAQNVQSYPIIGIDSFPDTMVFMRWQDVAALENAPGEAAQPTDLYVQFENREMTGGEADRKIAEIRDVLLQNGIIAGFWNQTADAEEESNLMSTVGLIFNIASAVMAAVGAIGLLTALSISVFERQREIGVMRSVGANSRTIAGQFLTEGLLVGIIAWLVGVPLSIGIATMLLGVLPLEDFELAYPPVALMLGLGGMLLIAITASLWPSLGAARKTVSDILRYQ